jgi:DNA helicase IV
MRDVVATIQREQFAIIRHPLERTVIVQGGPGTGKTVVGLHRAAWLAFNHPELRAQGVLVVAPSTTFLTYVSGVLPSLDVTDVDQVEIQALYAGEARVSGHDDAETARAKGSSAMAEVLRRALESRIGSGDEDIMLSLGADRIRIPAEQVRVLVADVRARDLSHSEGRELLRTKLSALAVELHRAEQAAQNRPVRANEATIRRLSGFLNALDRMWPTFTPEEFLRSLYSTQTWLVEATAGVLTADERARLYRPATASVSAEPWTEEDLYCLDEIEAMLTRDAVTYGHIVVDEAQDLSPMQARALRRRCPNGSFTMLGDLAQATGAWIRDSWEELARHLDGDVDVLSLSIGYRVPASVLELASGQLALFSRDLRVPVSIREGLGAPRFADVHEGARIDAVVAATRDGLADERSVAVIVADRVYDEQLSILREAAGDFGDGRDADFSHRVTLLPASSCKGLEFDAIVLVEPAEIVADDPQGSRMLYVAMTRCTQSLTVVHSEPLPAGFTAVDAPPDVDEAELSVASDMLEPAADAVNLDSRLVELISRLSEKDRTLLEQLVVRLLDGVERDQIVQEDGGTTW